MISFRNVSKHYPKEIAVDDVTFDIKKGEFIFLTGMSGSGKTTLMKMIYKGVMPTKGEVHVFDKTTKKTRTTKLRRRLGVVFQNYELLQNKTVYENVAYPLAVLGKSPRKTKVQAMKALERMNISEYASKKPNQLSGGQQQRVAIARAIVNNPDILICDEPTGNLDRKNTNVIMRHLIDLNERGTTVVMTTHDEEIVRTFKKRTLVMETGSLVKDVPEGETNNSLFNVINEKKVSASNKGSDKKKELDILKELGWTDEDEENYQRTIRGEA